MKPKPKKPDHVVHRNKDLRIPNTTPEELAKAVLTGGAKPRPETKPQAANP